MTAVPDTGPHGAEGSPGDTMSRQEANIASMNASAEHPKPQPTRSGLDEYVSSIQAHSQRSINTCLFPGYGFHGLSSWFRQANRQVRHEDRYCMAVLHDHGVQSKALCTFRCSQLADLPKRWCSKASTGQTLFLNGYPAADWIAAIGSRAKIDPEFFRRHFDFLVTLESQHSHYLPSLLSTTRNMIKLRVTTILYRGSPVASPTAEQLQSQRLAENEALASYHTHFSQRAKCGDSIVRQYTTIDERYSLLEQDISIYLGRVGDHWNVLVISDIGRDLSESPRGPWSETVLASSPTHQPLPVVQHHPKMSIRQTIHEKYTAVNLQNAEPTYTTITKHPQSTMLLPFELKTFLDEKRAAGSPLDSLINIFRHMAFSVSQTLNLLQLKVNQEIAAVSVEPDRAPDIGNLQFFEMTINRQIQHLNTALHAYQEQDSKNTSNHCSTNDMAADIEDLLKRAHQLISRCSRGMDIMMSRAAALESKKAIEQAQQMKKLTLLATFFVPLSFTTSLFGMNVKELVTDTDHSPSIWAWILVSVPILMCSFGFYFFDLGRLAVNFLKWICMKTNDEREALETYLTGSGRERPERATRRNFNFNT